jgi:hypothetical protein
MIRAKYRVINGIVGGIFIRFQVILKSSFLTSTKKHCIYNENTKLVMLLREIIVIVSEKYNKHINTLCTGNAQILILKFGDIR